MNDFDKERSPGIEINKRNCILKNSESKKKIAELPCQQPTMNVAKKRCFTTESV